MLNIEMSLDCGVTRTLAISHTKPQHHLSDSPGIVSHTVKGQRAVEQLAPEHLQSGNPCQFHLEILAAALEVSCT